MTAEVPWWGTYPQNYWSSIFYFANYNMKHTNDLKIYHLSEVESIKNVWKMNDDDFPEKNTPETWWHEFNHEANYMNSEQNWSTYWYSWAYR